VRKLRAVKTAIIRIRRRAGDGCEWCDELLVVVKDDLALVMPKPKRYARTQQGLAQGTYPSGYLKRERGSW
jgi:hypothetical protein